MDKEIEKLADIYFMIEDLILKKLERELCYGDDCLCNEPTNFFIVDDTNIIGYCLNCGGSISWQNINTSGMNVRNVKAKS